MSLDPLTDSETAHPIFMAVPLFTRAHKEIFQFFQDPIYREFVNAVTGLSVLVVMPKEITQQAGSVFFERAFQRFRVRKFDLPCLCLEDEQGGLVALKLPKAEDELRDLFSLLSDLADQASFATTADSLAKTLQAQLHHRVIPLVTDQSTGAAIALGDFERIVKANEKFNDPALFRFELEQREIRIARIELSGKGNGTGWLIAPDLLITAHHVIESYLNHLDKITARFDYKKVPQSGQWTLGAGRIVSLAPKPLIAVSKPDTKVNELSQAGAGEGLLDFAILRLAEPVGAQGLGAGGKGDEQRSHFQLPIDVHKFDKSDALFILGHPMLQGDSEAGPLKLTLGFPSQAVATASNRRVRYVVNTEVGNSGSPVLDQDFRPLILHNGGAGKQPNWDKSGDWPTGFNQGIPLSAIVAELRKQAAAQTIDESLLKELRL